jgi:hypothetical protein
LAELVSDDNAQVAEAAMALTLARGRRRDRFGRLGVEFDDLPAEDAVALAYAVAAGLKIAQDAADQPLAAGAQALLARHDEGRRLEASVATMARLLESTHRADDAMVKRLAEDGDALLLIGILARRAGIDLIDAWKFFTNGEAMLLARLAGCDRTTAAQMLAAFEPITGSHAAERIIDRFDAVDEAAVERSRCWMRLDPHYRAAREAMDWTHG